MLLAKAESFIIMALEAIFVIALYVVMLGNVVPLALVIRLMAPAPAVILPILKRLDSYEGAFNLSSRRVD